MLFLQRLGRARLQLSCHPPPYHQSEEDEQPVVLHQAGQHPEHRLAAQGLEELG